MSHTPGPWVWCAVEHPQLPILRSPTSLVCEFGYDEQFYPTSGDPPNDDDARLIAAAPELLDALREARSMLAVAIRAAWEGATTDDVSAHLGIKQIDAAINKATGGKP